MANKILAFPTSRMGFPFLLLGILLVPFVVGLYRYWQTLRFVAVPAHPSMADNMRLVQRFLEDNHFAYSRHPEAPEVFQIVSRNLGRKHKDVREVLHFIADDGRILLNSHYTQGNLGMPLGNSKSRGMAKLLQAFLEEQSVAETGTALRRW